jgi:ABC-type multidrug transport system fused ATPase/permease subunit
LKRLDSIARSPIYALLGESVDGAAVIRAFGAQETLFKRMISILDKQQHAYFLTCAAQSWLAVRLELVANLVVTFACASAVLQHTLDGANTKFAGLAGLAISYSLSVTQSLNWSVRMASDLEAAMVSVERIREYSLLESEGAQTTNVDNDVRGKWPISGQIEFKGAKLRYRPELPLVLKGLDLTIPGGSKVGVVGRTGAGKSTLMVSLIRIVELYEGKIFIDGVDTSTLGLSMLRSNIAVIPQDPVLFSGTVRSNLDPFDDHTDEVLLGALERVGLYKPAGAKMMSSDSLTSMANARVDSLDNAVSEGGSNFSVGQRQLLVIARALLRGTKIVIMDEATASIDAETDAMIQKVLRTAFNTATCLTVAHRLNTIMDSDYILVMDDGKAAEFDTPTNLLTNGGMFRDLVQAASR